MPNGETHKLEANEPPNHIHGGHGWHRRHWSVLENGPNSITFGYTSSDGDDRYPGTVLATTKYTLTQGMTLSKKFRAHLEIEMQAKLGQKEVLSTPINMVNHSYFNLAGHDYQNGVMDHYL